MDNYNNANDNDNTSNNNSVEGDLIFTSEQHYCIYCHKPIDIYKVEYLIMGPLNEQAWPEQAAKEKAIPKDAMPISIRKYWNKDKSMNDADFVCSSKCYEALQGSNPNI